VERHITLDRTQWGTDQAASLEPNELAALVRDIRTIEAGLGDGIKRVYPSELPARERLRLVQDDADHPPAAVSSSGRAR
jgi:N-acetylneuraminate synthase